MRQDLEQKVSVTLARFDKAVKESCTRRHSDPKEPQQQEPPEREVDLVERVTAETEEGSKPPAGMHSCTIYMTPASDLMSCRLLLLFSICVALHLYCLIIAWL